MTIPSRRDFLASTGPAAAMFGAAAFAAHGQTAGNASVATEIKVSDFGAVGDGNTPAATAFQQAIDAAEMLGGGVVRIPPGTFLLEKTPLIASGVHLMGAGAATVLRGVRPDDYRGAALISNKGQQSPGYEGAHDWGVSHLTIDSPHTNGIVVTHAARVYIGFIYGVDVYHHFVDTAGRDILCENLFLTGQSGTSSFQIDSLSGAQTIWDGEKAISPLLDGTDTENLILRDSIITATAGLTEHHDRHDVSIHFHGDEARGFLFSNLVLGGAETGFYQDANSAYHNIQISNVRIENPGRALWMCPGKTRQQHLMVRGLTHTPRMLLGESRSYRGIEIHGREGLLLADLQLTGDRCATTDFAAHIAACQQISITGMQARGTSGRGIHLLDGHEGEHAAVEQALIHACQFQGFDTGVDFEGENKDALHRANNMFTRVETAYRGLNA